MWAVLSRANIRLLMTQMDKEMAQIEYEPLRAYPPKRLADLSTIRLT